MPNAKCQMTHAGASPFALHFLLASVGGLLLWAAFPPLGFWPLAWLAPIAWAYLICLERPAGNWKRFIGYYAMLYAVGFVHWLGVVHWIRLPYWLAAFGWIALAGYLACYLPVFIGLSRVAVHRLRVPVMLAAPVVWVGLEYARGFLLSGFSMALLAHSQVDWLALIQASDLAGTYTVSFVMMFASAAIGQVLHQCSRHAPRVVAAPEKSNHLQKPLESKKLGNAHSENNASTRRGFDMRSMSATLGPLLLAAIVFGAVLAYGWWRLHESNADTTSLRKKLRVALIQGSVDTQFGPDAAPPEETFHRYFELSREAASQSPPPQLIVWPESMFNSSEPLATYDADIVAPPRPADLRDEQSWWRSDEQYRNWAHYISEKFGHRAALVSDLQTPLIAGCQAIHLTGDQMRHYNTALFINREGELAGRYDKMHPVMFGEYIPLGDVFPWLYEYSPQKAGLTAGKAPQVYEVNGVRISPHICFENTVPQLIRRQVAELRAQGKEPDVLVTVTNDGWFWGSSLLDLHLACGVFRAVENRKPLLIAANTGFSASITSDGRLAAKGPRRAEAVILTDVTLPLRPRYSLYAHIGDWPAAICLWACAALAGVGMWPKQEQRTTS